ncbi:hypothetical protein IFR05_012710 [Cadophora sp. M221]|nr:hypothetical protein IFR05_012710 [Cadophora sp. M221]
MALLDKAYELGETFWDTADMYGDSEDLIGRWFRAALVAYSPLGRGMLSGTLRSRADFGPGDLRTILPRFSEENFPKNLVVVDRIAEIARQKSITPAQLSLAWLLAQGDDVFPIPGTTRSERLFENVGALKVTLSKDEEEAVRTECESSGISGGRYPEVFAKTCFADTPLLKK